MTEAIRPPAPEAKIVLDRERTLRCDSMHAMRLFKNATGISLLRGELQDNVAEDNVAELVWAFLVHEDAELTIDAVAKLLHPGNLVDILSQVFALIVDSLPEQPTITDQEDQEGGTEDDDDPLAASA